MKYYKIQDKPK